MPSEFSRILGATRFLARKVFRSPTELNALLRSAGGTILDARFQEASPIQALPDELSHRLGSYEVSVPPANLFQSGNQDMHGLIQLVSLASALGARTIFEIGTYNGLTALTLARNLPDALVHTLDLATDETPSLPLQKFDYFNLEPHGSNHRVYEGTPEAVRIVQHLGDSARFDFTPFRNSCDLVYIDGSHSHEYVVNDSTRSFEIVSPNGVVVWDDYWRLVPDVSAYLHSVRGQGFFRLPGSRLVVWLSDGASRHLRSALQVEAT